MGRSHIHHLGHRHQTAVQMRHQHRPGSRAERFRQVPGSKVPVVGIDIDQHRLGADRVDAQEIAGVVVGGKDDLVAGADLEARRASSTA